jgi:ABC-type lipoprotein export system ATPase subunit
MTPKLKKICVKDLFGYLTYELVDLDSESSIFIIGNNGSGKSTVFKMIAALIESRWHTFHEVVFGEISFTFNIAGKEAFYRFRKQENVEWQDAHGEWHFLVQGSLRELNELEGIKQKAEWIFRNSSDVTRAKCGIHWSIPKRRHVTDGELVNYWESNNPLKEEHVDLADTSHPDMNPLNGLNVQFIQSNRLLALGDDNEIRHDLRSSRHEQRNTARAPIYQIDDLLRDKIRRQITGAFIQRDTIGNKALNTWLSQGNASENKEVKTVHELAKEIGEIESAFSEFSRSAHRTVLNIPDKLPEGYEPFLQFYLDSRLKQLSPLTRFLNQIELFVEICNSAFGYKEITLHENKGLTVRVNIGSHSQELDLSDLSSGEQQIIFLAYQLTIGAEHNALILIDEPELSLHLEWQKTFVSLLDRIGKQTKNNYLCATHSPAIVGSRVEALRNIEVDDGN